MNHPSCIYVVPDSIRPVYKSLNISNRDENRRNRCQRYGGLINKNQVGSISNDMANIVTPQEIAKAEASFCYDTINNNSSHDETTQELSTCKLAVDICSGLGNTLIALSDTMPHMFGIGIDSDVRCCKEARNRAYGHPVDFIQGRCQDVHRMFRKNIRIEILTSSPPWGDSYPLCQRIWSKQNSNVYTSLYNSCLLKDVGSVTTKTHNTNKGNSSALSGNSSSNAREKSTAPSDEGLLDCRFKFNGIASALGLRDSFLSVLEHLVKTYKIEYVNLYLPAYISLSEVDIYIDTIGWAMGKNNRDMGKNNSNMDKNNSNMGKNNSNMGKNNRDIVGSQCVSTRDRDTVYGTFCCNYGFIVNYQTMSMYFDNILTENMSFGNKRNKYEDVGDTNYVNDSQHRNDTLEGGASMLYDEQSNNNYTQRILHHLSSIDMHQRLRHVCRLLVDSEKADAEGMSNDLIPILIYLMPGYVTERKDIIAVVNELLTIGKQYMDSWNGPETHLESIIRSYDSRFNIYLLARKRLIEGVKTQSVIKAFLSENIFISSLWHQYDMDIPKYHKVVEAYGILTILSERLQRILNACNINKCLKNASQYMRRGIATSIHISSNISKSHSNIIYHETVKK